MKKYLIITIYLFLSCNLENEKEEYFIISYFYENLEEDIYWDHGEVLLGTFMIDVDYLKNYKSYSKEDSSYIGVLNTLIHNGALYIDEDASLLELNACCKYGDINFGKKMLIKANKKIDESLKKNIDSIPSLVYSFENSCTRYKLKFSMTTVDYCRCVPRLFVAPSLRTKHKTRLSIIR